MLSFESEEGDMAYREVAVTQVYEVLRQWMAGAGRRTAGRRAGVDHKTARRYIEAAVRLGLLRDGDTTQLNDELLGAVIGVVRPGAAPVYGPARLACRKHEAAIREWLDAGLKLTRTHELLSRRTGGVVPYRTLVRYVREELGVHGRKRTTVRVADCAPGAEVQVDFGRLGYIVDPDTGRRRLVQALIFTAVYSRHCFVWPTWGQTLDEVIEGFEQAWQFFGGVFAVVIIDNLKAVVTVASQLSPRINDSFLEYAQARGFSVDTARVRHPDDKPRVERMVPYVRSRLFSGEKWSGLDEVRERAPKWCREVAGMRVHGTTYRLPLEVFEAESVAKLGSLPTEVWDTPVWTGAKVGRDHHFTVGKALYSVPTDLIGLVLRVRLDRSTVKAYLRGQLVKVHPRVGPGGRQTDPADYPEHVADIALRNTDSLLARATKHGDVIGRYAEALTDSPLPWTRMRHVHRLLGLVRRYGPEAVSRACRKALECEVVDISRIDRMLQMALESSPEPSPSAPATTGQVIQLRFARAAAEFAVTDQQDKPPGEDHADSSHSV